MTRPDADRVQRLLSATAQQRIERINAFERIDSTNRWLKEQAAPQPGRIAVAIADHQTAGRGRHDREWLSAPGSSLCMSLAYTFRRPPHLLPPLTLAVGVATADVLAGMGSDRVRLKWPNDLLVDGRKLGGILVESQVGRRDSESAVTVVAGIGINLSVPDTVAGDIYSGWAHGPAGLDTCGAGLRERDELAAMLVGAVGDAMSLYDEQGLAPFEQAFVELDWLLGRAIIVETPDGEINGVAAGIDRDGSLLLQCQDRVQRIFTGSIRIADREHNAQQAV